MAENEVKEALVRGRVTVVRDGKEAVGKDKAAAAVGLWAVVSVPLQPRALAFAPNADTRHPTNAGSPVCSKNAPNAVL